jgi:hypothetical protein
MNVEPVRTPLVQPGLARSNSLRVSFLREVAETDLPIGPGPKDPVSDAALDDLPAPAQRYLRFRGVEGRPRTWSFRLRMTGLFRLRPDKPWLPCEAWQYNSSLQIARIFHMRLRLGGLVPVRVRDTYLHGRGRMLGRLLDAIPIVDVANDKITTGELVTYLNDALLIAPSMLLGPETTWKEVDDRSFDVALTDAGRTVRARVFLGERGEMLDFSTTDRFGTDPADPREMVRARWSTPVHGYKAVDGLPFPSGGRAIWHFASGDLPYADLRFDEAELELNVPPHAPR